MEYKVVMTIDAENDFDRHISYIVNQKKNLQAAGSVIEEFVNNPDGTPLYENTMQYAILKNEWLKGTSGDMTLQNSSDKSKAELLGILHEAEEDAKSGKVASIKELFDPRSPALEKKSENLCISRVFGFFILMFANFFKFLKRVVIKLLTSSKKL